MLNEEELNLHLHFALEGSWYFQQLFLDTLTTSPILNVERQVENFEVGIRIRICILL